MKCLSFLMFAFLHLPVLVCGKHSACQSYGTFGTTGSTRIRKGSRQSRKINVFCCNLSFWSKCLLASLMWWPERWHHLCIGVGFCISLAFILQFCQPLGKKIAWKGSTPDRKTTPQILPGKSQEKNPVVRGGKKKEKKRVTVTETEVKQGWTSNGHSVSRDSSRTCDSFGCYILPKQV